MKTIAEKIADLVAKQKAASDRMSEIEDSTEDADVTEYNTLAKDLDTHTARLKGLRAQEAAMATAKPIVIDEARGTATRGTPSGVTSVKTALPPGHGIARAVICLVNAKGNRFSAADMAKQFYKDSPEVALFLKAGVEAGDSTTSGWASQLIPEAQTMANEFLELLRPATLIGRIPGLRRVPFNVRVPLQTGGGSYGWVGENKPKPVTSMQFGDATLRWAKASGIVVITSELAKFSSPSAEAIIRDQMIKGCAQFLDGQFLDADLAETADHPAGITRDIGPETPSGTTAEAFLYDLSVLLASFTDANQDPSSAVLLISATTALNLSLMKNALGQREFPDITMKGGMVAGIPCIVSQTVSDRMVLVNASDILFADDGGISIDVSEQASVEMSTTPIAGESSPVDGAVLKSLWQNNLIGLRVERFITWKVARASAVAWTDNVAYAPTAPASPE